MRYLMYAGAAAISLGGSATSHVAQAAAQEQPPVIQTQANPPGAGIPTETPPNPPTADAPVPPAMPADPSYNAGPYKGALTPAPAEAMGKSYPLCTSRLQDSCINPGEAGDQPVEATPRKRAKPRKRTVN
jgi:hypothetical protein